MSLDLSNSEKLASFHQDARRIGVPVLAPSINESLGDFSVQPHEDGVAVRYALGAVRNVGLTAMESVVAERTRGGKFKSLHDFAERLDSKAVNRRQLENLAKAGAFDALEPERARAFAAAEVIAQEAARAAEARISAQASLFGAEEPSVRAVMPNATAWSAQERLDFERESVGFYLSGHPLSTFYAEAPPGKYASYSEILEEGEAEPRVYAMAGVLRSVKTRPAQSGGQLAYVALSDPTGEFEAIVMPEHLSAARDVLQVGKALVYRARARWRDGDLKMAVDTFEPLEAAEARQTGDIKIVLLEGAPVHVLAETIAQLEPARGNEARRLRLILRLKDGREVELAAPGVVPAGAGARAALKAARGVDRVM